MGFRDWFKRKDTLDPKIAKKKEELAAILNKAFDEGRYSFFEFDRIKEILEKCEKINKYDKYEFFFNLAKGWDEQCNLSRAAGEQINTFMRDESNVTAIHRTDVGRITTKEGLPNNRVINAIMKDGLENHGHELQGAFMDLPPLSLTTTPLITFGDLINLVGSYKNNNVTIILQYPRELVTNDLHFTSEELGRKFYNMDGDVHVIDPDYVMGVIVKSKDDLDEFYSREQLLTLNKTK